MKAELISPLLTIYLEKANMASRVQKRKWHNRGKGGRQKVMWEEKKFKKENGEREAVYING